MQIFQIQVIKYLLDPSKSEDNSSLILLNNLDAEEDGDGKGEDDDENREDGDNDSTESTSSIITVITTYSLSNWYHLNQQNSAKSSLFQETLVDTTLMVKSKSKTNSILSHCENLLHCSVLLAIHLIRREKLTIDN